jgi:prepilin-type N-terminal cleavage/methylation domain-containing protein|nr:prepilin-type N-terminal cleavage/methylation domain-containing protein [uncultured Lachnoclostridium sp.]
MHDVISDHRGLTLIEVIVSLLIASLVLLAVTGFLMVSTRTYRTNSMETSLQMESQIALNQIDDLLMKASSYEWVNDIVIDGVAYPVLGMKAMEETKGGAIEYYYAVIHDTLHKQLRFRKVKKEEVGESSFQQSLKHIVEEELKETPSLLANYVSSLWVSPATNKKENLVTVSILLELDGRTFSSFSSISMRNRN